jgi:inositol-phosphate phosphatase/L-galactose 1-phosphate phosphatase/histidinol-phosphatase
MSTNFTEFTSLIHGMTKVSKATARQYYRSNYTIDHKGDDSPVTIADREIERQLREIIETNRPDDGFLGEEHGTKPSQNGLMWVVDPIDGTKSFVAGRPSFGTLIGLWEGDTPLLGAIYQPITDELWLGLKDQKTTLNSENILTNSNPNPEKLRIGSTSPAQFNDNPELLVALRDQADFFVWGGDCYLYGMLAFGGLDVVIESGLATYDYAAIPSVVTGAGGEACDWDGNAMTLESKGDFLCASNIKIKDQILKTIDKYR